MPDSSEQKSTLVTPIKTGSALGRLSQVIKSGLTYDLTELFRKHRQIDDDLFEEIETLLLASDIGIDATERIISRLGSQLNRNELTDHESVKAGVKKEMLAILNPVATPLIIPPSRIEPFVILVIGINGSGKTTTIGKLGFRLQNMGLSVILAAGDTFRAAAVEQLREWGKRADITVVAQHDGADSASVLFDALSAARARNVDVLLADTAGRLHTHEGLMEELKKVRRVLHKQQTSAPQEILLVIDGGTGQNALVQAKKFKEELGVTGLAITKLDGTAKGGIIFSIAENLQIPIRFIGIGEKLEDLQEFNPEAFVTALLNEI